MIQRTVILLFYSVLVMLSAPGHAADISHEIRQSAPETSGFLEFTSDLSYYRVPIIGFVETRATNPSDPAGGLRIGLHGMFEWRDFFFEAVHGSSSNFAFGYNAWENERSRVALLFSSQIGSYTPGTVPGYVSVRDRDADLQFGIRSTHYQDNNIVQLELGVDSTGRGNGVVAAWQFGHFWQLRNWNLHALLGLRYFSADIVDFYFGIDESEVSEQTAVYQADHGVLTTAEFGAAIPLNEKWVFRTNATVDRLPDSVVDSPLTQARMAYDFSVGINYIF